MSRVNLDLAPDAIRQFVLSLLTEEGTVLEVDGRTVGIITPKSDTNGRSDPRGQSDRFEHYLSKSFTTELLEHAHLAKRKALAELTG